MQVAAILCDKATVREGLLHILGGGLSLLGRDELPAALGVDLALLVTLESEGDLENPHILKFTVTSPSGSVIVEGDLGWETEKPAPEGQPLPQLPFAANIANARIDEHGRYDVSISLDDEHVLSQSFVVTGITGTSTDDS